MGAKCCSDRKGPGPEAPTGAIPTLAGPDGAARKPTTIQFADGKKRTISIGYSSKGDDAEKFDRAFESGDLKGFVELLASEQTIESFEEKMHPWAADPRTVGALAGTQLAILASVSVKDNPRIKDDIREAGALPPLVAFLRSDQDDRVQTAAVALSFLSAECSPNAVQLQRLDAMPLLLPHLKSGVPGMRAAAATTLRNICMEGEAYRKQFVDLGGLRDLVAQLSTKPDPTLNHADVLLEAILNIQDLIETRPERGDPTVIREYAQIAITAGAVERLTALSSHEDEEVRVSAQELLTSLQTA